jgi:ferrous iron transport protein B
MSDFTIGVVGNPNCGKTTLFNALTGAKQRVGNWPGVTVDRKTGFYRHGGYEIEVIDTPGIYSLSAASVDEQVARNFVLSGDADLIINIVDASNIERNLYLTSQLLEMGATLLIALNMMDIAKDRQIEIDVAGLSKRLGCPVIPMVLTKNQGVDELKYAINKELRSQRKTKTAVVTYPVEIEDAVARLLPGIESTAAAKGWDAKWMAVKMLENDEQVLAAAPSGAVARAAKFQHVIAEKAEDDPDILTASAHYGFINWLTRDTVTKKGQVKESVSDKIDRVVLSRVLGIPIFLVAMYLMFMFTINLGGAFIDFFDQFAGAIFVDGFGSLLTYIGVPVWLKVILAYGVGGGIQTMATFIPPIGFMFLFLSFLEDSGYMARAAFVMDRFMRFIGLPGKSFIPMLVGFGCNVPAIMATRTLENERDRTLTIMMNPFMSCGARLPVYALFAAAFFPTGGQNLVFLLYLIGIGFAVVTGLLLKNTLLKGDITPFVMELPPYHLPTVKAVLFRVYDRLQTFLFKAGKVLVPVIVVLAFLNSLGTDGTFGNEDTEKSTLSTISKTITPALYPLGVTDENWPATVGVFTGIFAKEAVVGTLNALYGGMDSAAAAEAGEEGAEEETGFWGAIAGAFATIPANLGDLAGTLLDPLGISVGYLSDTEAAAEDLEVSMGTFGFMVNLFGSKVAAFAYLLFILLYFPCCAAIAAVYRETNLAWTVFAGFWTTFMAYFAATVFYQAATIGSHPGSSIMWIIGDLLALALVIAIMKIIGRKQQTVSSLAAPVSA